MQRQERERKRRRRRSLLKQMMLKQQHAAEDWTGHNPFEADCVCCCCEGSWWHFLTLPEMVTFSSFINTIFIRANERVTRSPDSRERDDRVNYEPISHLIRLR